MSTYKLKINNYQIIKSAELELKQGLTLIQGKSNHGKSSLFKALKQLLYNTSGTDYIKHGTPQCLIELQHLDNNNDSTYLIQYLKSKTKSQYTITTSQGTEVYQKLGSSQLDIIKNITHIDKQFDYNFWSQMEKPFLIGLTPREQFDILQNSPHSTTLQNTLQHMVQDRKQFANQEHTNQAKLELLQQQNSQYTQQLQQLPSITTLFNQITTLKQDYTTLSTLQTKFTHLTTLQQQITPLQQRLQDLHNLPTTSSLQDLYTTITTTQAKYKQLQQSVHPINDLQNQLHTIQTQHDQITCLIQTHFPNCPLCNQPFHNHTTEGGN